MPPPIRFCFLSAWLPVVMVCVLVFAQSCFPSPDVGLFSFPWKDKVQHIGVYGLLAVLFFRACRITWPGWQSPDQILMVSIVFVILYGAMDEWHQAFVPTRHASALDLLADAAGGGIGGLLARVFYFRPSGKQN